MTLTEIENLSADELKARRDELAAEAAKADPKELAARYVQARCDAKMRDVTLGEQGRTIGTLNDALGAAKEAIANHVATEAALTTKINELGKQHETTCGNAKAALESLGENLNETRKQLAAETARANRLAQLAARSEAAINAIAKQANDIIAARAVETTNEG